jgi:hypothetical protein
MGGNRFSEKDMRQQTDPERNPPLSNTTAAGLLRPLSRNTAQGASRIERRERRDLESEVGARYDVFFIFFFLVGLVVVDVAMT